MSDSCQRGREEAQAFIRKWKDFDKDSLRIVNEVHSKGRQGRIMFRLNATSKLRFVAGMMLSLFPEGQELTRAEWSQLSRISPSAVSQLLPDDESLKVIPGRTEEKVGPGPLDPGPAREKISIVLKDMEFREQMNKDAGFRKCFEDELTKCLTNDETIMTENLGDFADGLKKTLKSYELLKASREYCRFVVFTASSVSEFCKHRADADPDLRPIYRKKEREASEGLMALRNETIEAIWNVRHGNFAKRLGRSLIEDDIPKTVSLASDLYKLVLVLYFVCPWATNQTLKETSPNGTNRDDASGP
jgi:hypothetical protein